MFLSEMDKRIEDLRKEGKKLQDGYRKLARFLHANSLLPINDGYIDYLQYCINTEKAGARNTEVIANLEKRVTDYNSEMELFKRTLQNQRDAGEEIETLEPEDVFDLAGTLYRLPINGKQIRDQVTVVKIAKDRYRAQNETYIEFPAKAASSKIMFQLKNIFSAK
jgi:hypothetical protein